MLQSSQTHIRGTRGKWVHMLTAFSWSLPAISQHLPYKLPISTADRANLHLLGEMIHGHRPCWLDILASGQLSRVKGELCICQSWLTLECRTNSAQLLHVYDHYFDGLVLGKLNFRALAMELCLSCTTPSLYCFALSYLYYSNVVKKLNRV